jgi:hypothetical protein
MTHCASRMFQAVSNIIIQGGGITEQKLHEQNTTHRLLWSIE